MRVTIVVPTLNPGPIWRSFTAALLENLRTLGISPARVLVIDSRSGDDCRARAAEAGFRTTSIDPEQFDHGGTRQDAVEREVDADIVLFLAQDAILAGPDAIGKLLAAFNDPKIGAAYGRQLPRRGAGGIEAHARLYNYPPDARVRGIEDAATLGFKSIFASNAFCAFRRSALVAVGGFPRPAIFGEDSIAVASLHLAGWRSAYVADAAVYHSHQYTVPQEFGRYFDIGVMHARNPLLLEKFGTVASEGKRFVLKELRYLWKHHPHQMPLALVRTLTKLVGYRMGRREATLSYALRRRLSMNEAFWKAEEMLLRSPAEIPHNASTLGEAHAVTLQLNRSDSN